MTYSQTVYLAVLAAVTGLALLLPALRNLRRGARLYTCLADHAVLGAFIGIVVSLAASFAALCPTGCDSLFFDEVFPRLLALGAFGVSIVFLLSRMLPDTWIAGDLSEEAFQTSLDKALAQSGLEPERTVTGLKMAPGVILRVYYWRRASRCLMEWHPRGSAGRFPEFRKRLQEVLASVDSPMRRRRATLEAAVGLLFLAASFVLGCTAWL